MSVKVTEFPVCFILRLKDYPAYAPHTKFAYALYAGSIRKFLEDPTTNNWAFTNKIELAKRWSTHKKLKAVLKQYSDGAKYYWVVGSDGTVVDAESLL